MSAQLQKLTDLAAGQLGVALATAKEPDVSFKRTLELKPGGGLKVLVVGSVHREFQDGFSVAILEPDPGLAERLNGGVAYSKATLRELVAKRCRAMAMVMRVGNNTFLAAKYEPRGG